VGRSVIRTVRTEKPLLFLGGISVALLLAGGVFGVHTATHYYTTREFWPGKALLSMLCLIVGMQLGIAALTFDYFKRWHERAIREVARDRS
jgi:hypothetical protein